MYTSQPGVRGRGAPIFFPLTSTRMRYVHERFLPLSRAHVSPELSFNPLPSPGIVVGAVHGRRGTRAATRVQATRGQLTLSYRPKFGHVLFLLTGLRAQTAMPCIGPSTASHPGNHDASWSDPVERLVLGSHDRVDGLYKVA